jgi:hypothetical protein
MFNRKKIKELTHKNNVLSDRIDTLNNQLKKSDEEIASLRDDVWKLNNPPKFKAGDNVLCYIVLDSKVMKFFDNSYPANGYRNCTLKPWWEYSVFNNATNTKEIKTEAYLVSAKSNFKSSQSAPKQSTKKK